MSGSLGPSVFGAPLGLDFVLVLVLIVSCCFLYLRIEKNAEAVRRRHERECDEQLYP